MKKTDIIWNALKKYGALTNIEIQQIVFTTCPHSIIRDLREKYGADSITDEWLERKREYREGGKVRKETVRYKKYIFRGAAV